MRLQKVNCVQRNTFEEVLEVVEAGLRDITRLAKLFRQIIG
jgi:hypothetical protein